MTVGETQIHSTSSTIQRSTDRWIVFAICSAAYLISYFHRMSSAVMAPSIAEEFGVTAIQLGFLSSTYFWAYAVLQLPVGILTDRHGPRAVISTGTAVAALGTIVFGTARQYGVALIGRTLTGVGVAAVYVPSLKLLGASFGAAEFATVTGLFVAVGNLGAIMAGGPFAAAVSTIGWRAAFLVIGAITAAVSVASIACLRDKHSSARPPEDAVAGQIRGASPERDHQSRARAVAIGTLGAIIFLKYGPLMAYQGLWGAPYLMEVRAMTSVQAGKVLAAVSFGYLLGGPAGGVLADRTGMSHRTLLVATSAIYLAAWAPLGLFAATASTTVLCLSSAVMGIMSAASGIVTYSMVREFAGPDHAGKGLGVVNTCSLGGGSVFQLALGSIIDRAAAGGLAPAAAYAAAFRFAFLGVLTMAALTLTLKGPAKASS
ncbi:MAG: MFS transporter [Clostridia bacterium]|nr:MFS transporter [Clostridia bacterium]